MAQNKVVRFILNLKPMTRIDYSVLSDINILKVEDRAKQLRLNHVYNIFHELAPQYLNQNFLRVSECHSYSTRGSAYNFKIPPLKGCDSQTFYYNAILDWNNLPDDIKSIENRTTYKPAVKRHLFTTGQSNEASSVIYF